MPELPEVETVRKTLSPKLIGRKITAVQVFQPSVIAYPQADFFSRFLCGQQISAIDRRGKFLIFRLKSGCNLIGHLRMTGRFLYNSPDYPRPKHCHIIFTLSDGNELRFVDTRRFGRMWLILADEQDNISGIHRLGPEPFDEICTPQYYHQSLRKKTIPIKQALLEQSLVAGLGNIYVDEALFAAKINPLRPANSVNLAEWQLLAKAICDVLSSAIANNGTTFRDYVDGEGKEGQNMPFLQAYGRYNQPCSNCGEPLSKIKISGRSTCYCTKCQL